MASFGRSQQLVRGRGWHVFGTLVLTWIILLVVNIVLGLIFVALPHVLSNGLSSVISGTLVAPFNALVVTLVYYRLTATSADPVPPGAGYGGYQQTLWPARATASGLPDGQIVRQAAVFRPAPPSGRGSAGRYARTVAAAAQCCSRCGTRSIGRSSGKNSRAPSTVTTRVVPGMVSRSQ